MIKGLFIIITRTMRPEEPILAKHKCQINMSKKVSFIDTLGHWQVGDTIKLEDINGKRL